MNKKIPSAQCVFTSSVDIPDLHSQLKETKHLPGPDTPSLTGQPSQEDALRLVENIVIFKDSNKSESETVVSKPVQ